MNCVRIALLFAGKRTQARVFYVCLIPLEGHSEMKAIRTAISISCLLLLPIAAHATLGKAASAPVALAQKAAGASLATAGVDYTVSSKISRGVAKVTEYANKNGVVFAVAWNGPRKPDLHDTLGDYLPAFEHGAIQAAANGGLNARMIYSENDVVVSSQGHPGALYGFAYLKSQVPANFDLKLLLQK